jgi:hypothetical protein
MDGSGAIVTLRWGGFRCRLEGFEEPMAALAEALEWLGGAQPDTGLGPVTTRGAPAGLRREYRNGALVLSPAEPRGTTPDAPRPPRAEPGASPFGTPPGGVDRGPEPAPGAEPTGAPVTALELIRMGLVPDGDPSAALVPDDLSGPPAAAGPQPSGPAIGPDEDDHHEAILRLIRSHGAGRGAPVGPMAPEDVPPRRARRIMRPSGASG